MHWDTANTQITDTKEVEGDRPDSWTFTVYTGQLWGHKRHYRGTGHRTDIYEGHWAVGQDVTPFKIKQPQVTQPF